MLEFLFEIIVQFILEVFAALFRRESGEGSGWQIVCWLVLIVVVVVVLAVIYF